MFCFFVLCRNRNHVNCTGLLKLIHKAITRHITSGARGSVCDWKIFSKRFGRLSNVVAAELLGSGSSLSEFAVPLSSGMEISQNLRVNFCDSLILRVLLSISSIYSRSGTPPSNVFKSGIAMYIPNLWAHDMGTNCKSFVQPISWKFKY